MGPGLPNLRYRGRSADPVPDGGLVPVTPGAVKHFQFTMPVGAFDFWVEQVYFVRAK